MAFEGQKLQRFFGRPEIVRIKCDVQSWMTSYIAVLENPYHFVTADDGAFRIGGLPAGTYEVEAWHESYGTRSGSVTVAEGETGALDFTFSSSH